MPYIITTTTPPIRPHGHPDRNMTAGVSRRAVATLAEARAAAAQHVYNYARSVVSMKRLRAFFDAAHALPVAGGTVGPLPDGTVIEVGYVGWRYIQDSLGYHLGYPDGSEAAIAAYNAAQEGRA